MASFTIRLTSSLAPERAWDAILDLAAHDRVVPLTRLTGTPPAPVALRPGTAFTARTRLGPWSFDDPMSIVALTRPVGGTPGSCRIVKGGDVVMGVIELVVGPHPQGSRVQWRQEITVRGVSPVADPAVALVARAAYGATLRRLLALAGDGARSGPVGG